MDIRAASRSDEPATRLVAHNLIADHRVSRHCGEKFFNIYKDHLPGLAGTALANALLDYRKAAAADPHDTFLSTGNDSNFIPAAGKTRIWRMYGT